MTTEKLDNIIKAIEDLQLHNHQLETKLAHVERAHQLSFNLIKRGSVAVEEFDTLYKKFKSTPLDELHVIEKAAELVKEGHFHEELGELIERPQNNENPLIAYLLSDD